MLTKKCSSCRLDKPVGEFGERKRGGHYAYCKACKSARWAARSDDAKMTHREKNVAYRARLRQAVLVAYGEKCECCAEGRHEFLALDHRNGGGTKERRELASNTSGGIYRLARDAGYPKDRYRLLCHNCNLSLGFYGYCPHQKERTCG